MTANTLLIICTHGTYGRDDDLYGALLAANASLAKGMNVSLVLVEEGVFACKKNQNTTKIGLPNTLEELNDFLELGGKLIVDSDSLEERGMIKSEVIEGSDITPFCDLGKYIEEYDISLTF